MARNLIVNGVTYPEVESLTLVDTAGNAVLYTEEGAEGESITRYVLDDGEGNLTIRTLQGCVFTDDGEGDLVGEVIPAPTAVDDGDGNISFV